MRQVRLASTAFLLSFLVGVAHAEATTIGFSGPYAPANWTIIVDQGAVDTTGAPAYVDITSGSICTSGSSPDCRFSRQQFLFTAFEDAFITFDWDYLTIDLDGPFYDPFIWSGGGQTGGSLSVTEFCGPFPPSFAMFCHQTGSGSFLVHSGEVFGFTADSVDSAHGPAVTRVSNFTASTVPEPTTLILIGTGLAVGALRRRRSTSRPGQR